MSLQYINRNQVGMKKIMNTSLLPGFPAHHIPYTSNARLGLSHGMPLSFNNSHFWSKILHPQIKIYFLRCLYFISLDESSAALLTFFYTDADSLSKVATQSYTFKGAYFFLFSLSFGMGANAMVRQNRMPTMKFENVEIVLLRNII